MEGIVINYRRGRRTQTTNQMIIEIDNVSKKEEAEKLIGKEVVYICEGKNKKEIKGKISSSHGNKGAVRVLFEKGMPGQAIGGLVKIN